MGLHGKQFGPEHPIPVRLPVKQLPWKRPGLSRPERVIAFLQFLPVTKGKKVGKKMRLLPDQAAFMRELYGRSAKRRVRLAIFSQARGNGKTGMLAGLTLCHLLGPESEPRGECYSAGIDRLQASLIFNEMEAIIHAVPEFASHTNIQRFRKVIEVLGGDGAGSKYEALSADGRRAHGLAPSFWCFDELAGVKDRILLDNLQTAMGKRRRSLGVIISTQAASDIHPLSELIDDGLRGKDSSILVHLKTAPVDADPFDQNVIRACNPALGNFLDEGDIFAEAERARRLPSFESAFRNLRLNQRIAPFGRDLLMTAEAWAAGDEPIDESIFTDGRPVYGGLDLSACVDLTALVLCTADDGGVIHMMPRAWTPAETITERTITDRAPYDVWVRKGQLIAVPGAAIDLDFVAQEIGELSARMNIVQVNYDRWRISLLEQALARQGLTVPLVPHGQGYKDMAPAVDEFEKTVSMRRFRHGAHPLLKWCFGNAVVIRDAAGNRKLDKAKAYGRVDVAVAAVMAVGAMKASVPQVEIAAMIA
ncbi:terminase large subunit [Bradyrhizobium sp. McL0616]|uniref:terminase large subunit n=1 Tax=Bradyrhizobium sp. McL0616 TaxID=3415674 RepID=UPI003CEB0B88